MSWRSVLTVLCCAVRRLEWLCRHLYLRKKFTVQIYSQGLSALQNKGIGSPVLNRYKLIRRGRNGGAPSHAQKNQLGPNFCTVPQVEEYLLRKVI